MEPLNISTTNHNPHLTMANLNTTVMALGAFFNTVIFLTLDWAIVALIFAAFGRFETSSERREFARLLVLLKWGWITAYCLMDGCLMDGEVDLKMFFAISVIILAADAIMGVAAAVVYFGGAQGEREGIDVGKSKTD